MLPGETVSGTIGNAFMPKNLNMLIYSGDDFEIPVQLQDSNSQPIDLTGYTGACQFRRNYEDISPVNATVTIEPGGLSLVLSLSSTQTSSMTGDYIYDLQLTNPAGKKRTYLTGDVTVYKQVTT